MQSPPQTAPATAGACVIGAGLGGLALAIRLQSAGIATCLIEAQSGVGGLVRGWQADGFAYEAGPAMIADAMPLRELWALSGADLTDAITLHPVQPTCRFSWPDGRQFDLGADPATQAAQIARIAPGDLAGFEDFRDWCAAARADDWQRLAEMPLGTPRAMLQVLPALFRNHGWRSAHGLVSHFIKDARLRQALTWPLLEAGGNPFATGALHLAGRLPPGLGPAWWPQGGFTGLAQAMARHFTALGGVLRLHDPVVSLHPIGNRIGEIECRSGWRLRAELVASDADPVHTCRDLLAGLPDAAQHAARLTRRRFGPSAFTLHFALEGSWPGIPHRTVLFGPRDRGLVEDLFVHGVLPQDLTIDLRHPSVTDPTLAPAGKSVFNAVVQVPNLARLPIDWAAIGPLLSQRVLAEVGRRLIPDLPDRLIACRAFTPRDLALDFSVWAGAAWSLEPSRLQSGPLRPPHRDRRIVNLYRVGAGTHPGAGLAAVLAGAKASATLMLENLT